MGGWLGVCVGGWGMLWYLTIVDATETCLLTRIYYVLNLFFNGLESPVLHDNTLSENIYVSLKIQNICQLHEIFKDTGHSLCVTWTLRWKEVEILLYLIEIKKKYINCNINLQQIQNNLGYNDTMKFFTSNKICISYGID